MYLKDVYIGLKCMLSSLPVDDTVCLKYNFSIHDLYCSQYYIYRKNKETSLISEYFVYSVKIQKCRKDDTTVLYDQTIS